MVQEWQQIKEELKSGLSRGQYDLWVSTLDCLGCDDDQLVLGCKNWLHVEWVRGKIHDRLLQAAAARFPEVRGIRYKIIASDPLQVEEAEPETDLVPRQISFADLAPEQRPLFNPRFTFDQFVVGQSNQFAYATCRAIAGDQPFFNQSIYLVANPGLGKSHLAHAVGNLFFSERSGTRVHYVTSEQFANEMIGALKQDRIEGFKRKYRENCDVLLLEKIEFFSGKRKIQDELVYTLDELLDRGKKIVCTGNASPKDIPKLNSELRSRLSGVLVAPIEPPDFHTRVAIVRKKAAYENVKLPAEVAEFLADQVTSDVRQLESCLIGVMAKSNILGVPISLALAQEVSQALLDSLPNLGMENIVQTVCSTFGVTPNDLRSRARGKQLSQARHVAMYLCRQYTSESLASIARAFGRSHSTVLYAVRRMQQELDGKNASLKRQVDYISRRLETGCLFP